MTDTSFDVLERFRIGFGQYMDLNLRPAYLALLARLGSPQNRLPPVFHVAGTNGKGSTCAFLRAFLESAGKKVHVFTSPHLVRFHERIRVAGELISEEELTALLLECEKAADPGQISLFEALTAVAFMAFARTPADAVILETGLGGRLDATNVIERPLATLITRLSFDHRDYLGDSIDQIAFEKAGIMRQGVPCFTAPQPNALALSTLRAAAAEKGTPLFIGGKDWHVTVSPDTPVSGFHFADSTRQMDLPPPVLLGDHQFLNAGLALAALAAWPEILGLSAYRRGLECVSWPARLQKLSGALTQELPPDTELWLDGGHNDSAGEVLAHQIEHWRQTDGATPKPLYVITGMLTTKRPAEFLGPFAAAITALRTLPIPNNEAAFRPLVLAAEATRLGIPQVAPAPDITTALRSLPLTQGPARILICGSLYLAGEILRCDGDILK